MMMRAQYPIQFTALSMFAISMDTFVNVSNWHMVNIFLYKYVLDI